jgi:hypothetical protein
MDVWLIYRIIKSADNSVSRIESVEYCLSEAEARKYSRLFDLQTPIDLRDKISHKYFVSQILEQ